MAIFQPNNNEQQSLFIFDSLYCEEEKWDCNEQDEQLDFNQFVAKKTPSLFSVSVLEQDLFWEDGELLSLFKKEQEIAQFELGLDCSVPRQEAVDWILKVNSHYGFSTLTAILAVNYVDRFMSCSCFQKENKPWMSQLVAVTCLSLAAKVEETQVPLLLDLQVEDVKYVFEAKTIQRMELLVLSALKWKMHPVTPISFLDHIIRRLGLKTSLHWEFLRQCECLLLNLVSDSRSSCFLPSVLATATMMHVIGQVEHFNPIEYQNQLLSILKIDKDKVNECYEVISEVLKRKNNFFNVNGENEDQMKPLKRKFEAIPSSPSGVIDANFSIDNSSDCWAMASSSSSSVSSSPQPVFKKNRTQDQWFFVDFVGIGNGTSH